MNITTSSLDLLNRLDNETKLYFYKAAIDSNNPNYCKLEELSAFEIHKLREIFAHIAKIYTREGAKNYKNELQSSGLPKDFLESLPMNFDSYHLNEVRPASISSRNISWRIGISSSNSTSKRANCISILIKINVRSGGSVTFITDASTFHKLRYNITHILKEINMLKQCNKIMSL